MDKDLKELIEWILNDVPLLNRGTKEKLEDRFIGNIKYVKDLYGNILETKVID